MRFSEKDKERIAAAVKSAESKTSGEIVPLVVRAADSYLHADLVGGICGQALAMIAGMWLAPDFGYLHAIGLCVLGFCAGFGLVRVVPGIKRLLVGGKITETEVYQRALQAFFEHGLTRTRDRTGILIMVSLMERRVQILADEGINEKVEPGAWEELVEMVLHGIREGSLTEGLCRAIERCGEILACDFPIKDDDVNELADGLIEE